VKPNGAVTLCNRLAASKVFGGGIDPSCYCSAYGQPLGAGEGNNIRRAEVSGIDDRERDQRGPRLGSQLESIIIGGAPADYRVGASRKAPRPVAGGEADGPLGFAENALDLVDGDPVDLGNLGSRHSVLHPGADTIKLRPRDFRRHLLIGADRCFALHMGRGRRCDCQHARLARR
jgi:hypothetical protein